MAVTKIISIIIMMLGIVLPGHADSVEGLPLHVKKVTPGVVSVWTGDQYTATVVTGIATSKGIVVIDSTMMPKLDKAYREVIARELGRNDFKYLINTHDHIDHTLGNSVYADCEIVAHEYVGYYMKMHFAGAAGQVKWYENDIKEKKQLLASGNLSSKEEILIKEQLIVNSLCLEYFKNPPQPTLPTITFKDKMTLDCGDTKIELYYAGGTHTQTDTFIFVPEKGFLFTGDMMIDKWLTDSATGCLVRFSVDTGSLANYPVLLKNWKTLIDRKDRIKHYIPAHWNGELSAEGFQSRYNYVNGLVADVKTSIKNKEEFKPFVNRHTLEAKFPHLVNSPGFSEGNHQMSVSHLYSLYSGKAKMMTAIGDLVGKEKFSEGFAKLREDVIAGEYIYSQNDFVVAGYYFLQTLRQSDNAANLFKLQAELYPASPNAYDSLADAYMAGGQTELAIENFQKAVDLATQQNDENLEAYKTNLKNAMKPDSKN